MKKVLSLMLAGLLVLGASGVSEAQAAKGSFSGGSKPSVSSGSKQPSSSYNSPSSNVNNSQYSSGQKSPSSNVTKNPSTPSQQPYQQPQQKRSWLGGAGTFLGGMAAGAVVSSLFSNMLHPFGGMGSGGGLGMPGFTGFSFMGLLLDAAVILIGIWLVRKLFLRRR